MVIRRTEPDRTHFLNVDLDILSRSDLAPLAEAFGDKVMVMFVGRVRRTYHLHLEVAALVKNADATIRRFCKLIEALPRSKRLLWDRATRRDFNIGIQAGTEPLSAEFPIEAETVARAAWLKAGIMVTVYRPDTEEEWRAGEDARRKVAEMDAEDERTMAARAPERTPKKKAGPRVASRVGQWAATAPPTALLYWPNVPASASNPS